MNTHNIGGKLHWHKQMKYCVRKVDKSKMVEFDTRGDFRH